MRSFLICFSSDEPEFMTFYNVTVMWINLIFSLSDVIFVLWFHVKPQLCEFCFLLRFDHSALLQTHSRLVCYITYITLHAPIYTVDSVCDRAAFVCMYIINLTFIGVGELGGF